MAAERPKQDYFKSVRKRLDDIGIGDQQLIVGLEEYLVRNKRLPPSVRRRVMEQINANDDPLTVIDSLAQLVRPVIPRKSSHRETRTAAQTLSIHAKGEGRLLKQEPSSAFAVGSAAHSVAERIYRYPLETIITDSGTRLICQDGRIQAFYSEKYPQVKQQYLLRFDQTDSVNLSVSIDAPENGWLTADWVLKRLSEEMNIIGQMPTKTYDVDQILNGPDEEKRRSLIRILEICQMTFGNSSAMSIIDEVDGTKFISKGSITPFKALNWLGLMALVIDVNKDQARSCQQDNRAMLAELSLGKVSLATDKEKTGKENIVIYGGKYDLVEVKIPNLNPQQRDLATVTEMAEAEFSRYKKQYRRKDETNHDLGGKLGRNLFSYLWYLRKEYGKKIFKTMEIIITDFKFPGGDGDMWKTYNINHLPIAKHVEHMQDYILSTICQIYLLCRQPMSRGVGDGLDTIDVQKAIGFAVGIGLIDRIKVKLNYQIPGKNQIFEVVAHSADELQKWADRRIRETLSLYPEYQKRRLLEMVSSVLWSGKKVDIERRTENRPPEEISTWCQSREGHNYLLIAEFTKNREYKLIKAQNYNQGVLVIWLRLPGQQGQVRIALRKDGKFRITDLPDTNGAVYGSVCSSIENICQLELKDKLWEAIQSNLWRFLQERIDSNLCLEENQWLNKGWLTDANGSFIDRLPNKPIVWSFDAFTGIEYLEPGLLKKAIEDQGERDPYGFRDIAANLEKQQDNLQVMCPRPNHRNTHRRSEAATMHPDLIYCHRCGVSIHIRGGKIGFEGIKPLPSPDYPDHYKPVSDDRDRCIHTFIAAADRLSRFDDTLDIYLKSRGLTRKDLEPCGYIPLDISKAMSLLLTQAERMYQETKEEIWRWNVIKKMKVAWFVDMLNDKGKNDLYQWAKEQTTFCGRYPEGVLRDFWESVDLETLGEWKRRGLVGSQTETSWDRMGGRVIMPTGWMADSRWRLCNVNARGIVVNGKELYEGEPHHKAFLVRGTGDLRPPPPGIWIPNWEKFLLETTDTVLIMEGVITTASFFKLVPGWEGKAIAGMGLPIKQLVAFFRWLGVEGYDPKEKHVCLGKNIKRIIFAPDFDEGGGAGWENFVRTFSLAFPKLKIGPVHDILNGTGVEHLVRPYDPALYKEGGIYFEQPKIDFNDIWRDRLNIK